MQKTPHKVTPIKHPDGTETVRLYGTTVDVTSKKEFTLFKKQYKVYRPRRVGKLKADVVLDKSDDKSKLARLENLQEAEGE